MPRYNGFTLIEMLVVVAIIGVLAAVTFPVLATARKKAWQTTCSSNQRQLVLAIHSFAQDHEELLPSTATVWKDTNIDPGILLCQAGGASAVANSYVYNARIAGKALGELPDPTVQLLTADGVTNANNLLYTGDDIDLRHTGKAVLSYADGHVVTTSDLPFPFISGLYCWLAADQGLAAAQNNLGVLYVAGNGVAKDGEEAVKWFRKAAAAGHQEAKDWLAKNGYF